jgi:YidC/Oxa1 family membrane protein insertase
MFDWLFEGIAATLAFFYDLVPNYAFAIAMLTIVIMVVTTPFTLKGTRSMIQMQILQPEMRRLQLKYKDDRQKLNEELMAFYKENNLNPLGGCLPLLLQAPIFLVLYRMIAGLTTTGADGTFDPKYLDHSSSLYQALHGSTEMMSLGIDLSESASQALSEGFIHGLPHILLVVIVAITSYYQQRQIQSRNPNAEIPQQQKILMRVFPLMIVAFSFVAPSAIVIYFIVSNLYRIGMQAYITRSLYHGEGSLGAKAQAAAAEARKIQKDKAATNKAATSSQSSPKRADAKPAKPKVTTDGHGNGSSSPPKPTARTSGGQNRSKKKKKRR